MGSKLRLAITDPDRAGPPPKDRESILAHRHDMYQIVTAKLQFLLRDRDAQNGGTESRVARLHRWLGNLTNDKLPAASITGNPGTKVTLDLDDLETPLAEEMKAKAS